MLITSKSFKHENKCVNCGKGELRHRSHDKACPISSARTFAPNFYEDGKKFVDSGEPTLRSIRHFNRIKREEDRLAHLKKQEEEEKAKVRSMTLEEVVYSARKILLNLTGLDSGFRYTSRPHTVEIYLMANGIVLGKTSITKTLIGTYIVGGSFTGCFTSSDEKNSLFNRVKDPFFDLEERANKEKK